MMNYNAIKNLINILVDRGFDVSPCKEGLEVKSNSLIYRGSLEDISNKLLI